MFHGISWDFPSGKRLHSYGKIHHSKWELCHYFSIISPRKHPSFIAWVSPFIHFLWPRMSRGLQSDLLWSGGEWPAPQSVSGRNWIFVAANCWLVLVDASTIIDISWWRAAWWFQVRWQWHQCLNGSDLSCHLVIVDLPWLSCKLIPVSSRLTNWCVLMPTASFEWNKCQLNSWYRGLHYPIYWGS